MSTNHFPSVDGSFLHPVTVSFSSTLWIPVLWETPQRDLAAVFPVYCVQVLPRLHILEYLHTPKAGIPFLHRGPHSLPQCLLFLINGHLLNKILIHHLLVCHAPPLSFVLLFPCPFCYLLRRFLTVVRITWGAS